MAEADVIFHHHHFFRFRELSVPDDFFVRPIDPVFHPAPVVDGREEVYGIGQPLSRQFFKH
jgi:hypothetical protein